MEVKRMTKQKFSEIARLLRDEKYKTFQGNYSRVYKRDNVIYRVEDDGYTEVIVIGNKSWTRNYKGEITLSYLNSR